MKKNPGRKERRRLFFQQPPCRRTERAKMNEYRSSHYWLPKFRKQV